MVALHNRRLTAVDIFPDNLWTEAQWHAKRDQIETEARAEGFTGASLIFETSKRMSKYHRRVSPGLRRQQEVMRMIYPPRAALPGFTEEELWYMLDKLFGVNDPMGQALRDKISAKLV